MRHGQSIGEGRNFWPNDGRCYAVLRNGSEILAKTWADRKAKRGRSLDITMCVIEEATENDEVDEQAINEIVARLGRRRGWPRNLAIFLTNPDSPSHWLYKRFFVEKNPNRHVFHSVTMDNPFLPDTYVQQLKSTFDSKMIQRMLYGKWVDILGETIYYEYSNANEPDENYEVNPSYPIHMSWDFNIGDGKPLSTVFYQVINDTFHFFDEVVIEGARTESNLEDAANRGLFEIPTRFLCHGDASGTHKDTRNNLSDYGIIDKFMTNYQTKNGHRLQYAREVPASNPRVRNRHNIVNGYLKNSLGLVRVKVYSKCKVLREGFRLTKLRKGAEYVEDDSKFYQHITTAAGYAICWYDLNKTRKRSEIIQR
jgi:hypothetical protein